MNKKMFAIILMIALPLTFIVGWKCKKNASQLDEIGKPSLTVINVRQDKNAKSLFFVTKRWGLTGDHQVVALTNERPQDDNWRPDDAKDYVWQGDILIYYQKADDHVRVWANYLPDTTKKKLDNIEFIELRDALFNQLRKESDEAIKVVD